MSNIVTCIDYQNECVSFWRYRPSGAGDIIPITVIAYKGTNAITEPQASITEEGKNARR